MLQGIRRRLDRCSVSKSRWQTRLAVEAAAGRGLNALGQILAEIKAAQIDDEAELFEAMRECADRHLTPPHEIEAVDAVFDAAFHRDGASEDLSGSPDLNRKLDATTSNNDAEAEFQRLSKLPIVQYERERVAVAERLGMRASVLDAAVKAARPTDTKGQGRSLVLPSIEPWPSPVNGAELLDEICGLISRYIVLPLESIAAVALWIVHTHCFDCFAHSPRLAIISPEKGCGKTTLLDVLYCLVARPLDTANATVSAIFRIVELAKPTLLIDEADTFLGDNDELRGILNAGHRRGGQVTRTVGEDHEPRQFSTWAPAAIAMIGRLPDTLNDRSIIVSLKRRKASERVDSFRRDRASNVTDLARKIARWVQDHQAELSASDPDAGELINRVADNWRPLFAIAEAAGEPWPKRIREIAGSAVKTALEQSVGAQLLADIRWIFNGCPAAGAKDQPVDRISSAVLVESLVKIEGRPWAEWKGGKPLSQNSLARLLGRYEILSGTIRLGSQDTCKGYYRNAFDDAFSCYLPLESVTPSQLNNHGHCDGVTVSNPHSPRMEGIDL